MDDHPIGNDLFARIRVNIREAVEGSQTLNFVGALLPGSEP
ncbi:hypothetical protein [Photobacterium sanguinicancri]|nr:hypothetical protein [Photobacterium sanguinicancri]MDO6498055.1 hypothetical protein [Photobacterium sanguinicancri]